MGQVRYNERDTQDRIIALFQRALGYRYLGNWKDREVNSNIEEAILRVWLQKRGYSSLLIDRALHKLKNITGDHSRGLYYVNKDVYTELRYGVTVKSDAGQNTETVWLIDWKNPEANDFAIAEEVTVKGVYSKRPDIVLYVNGIALGVLELKRSTVSISEGIRQNEDNQKDFFIAPFFSTVQYIMAGNDHEGIAYGAVGTKEKYFLKWKEVREDTDRSEAHLLSLTASMRKLTDSVDMLVDKNIIELLNKERFIEMVHDFVVYDRGQKKLCRHNQYFGVKAAQDHIQRREGGILWHTQGSGKSLTMVWLSKWILETNPHARILIITDRDELDEQIEKVYKGVEETIYRTGSERDMLQKLHSPSPRLMCSLIQKFRGHEEGDIENYVQKIAAGVPSDFRPKGDIYVFVDECHRTQSGKLHKAMKTLLPDALFIGFTGTPLLKTDRQTSMEVFGKYIHIYRFDEAVHDKVVLDLRYEARDIEQKLSSPAKIDEWFELKTRGLTDIAKAELKQKWGTIRKVFSSKSRLEKITDDIMMDMAKKERLQNGRGNAMLVSDSIYNACRYYELFQRVGLKECAIITSFVPTHADIKGEGADYTEKIQQFEIYQKMLGDYFHTTPEEALKKVEEFERQVKEKFIDEPAQMKLLIVVNKLLTGFDAPSATYLYIDKKLQDHGLFQAVCRVNRLDGEDKEYGYIIDYRDLFGSLKSAFEDYTSGAFDAYEKEDVAGLLQNRLKKGKEQLDNALESIKVLCEPVSPPKKTINYIHYFCGEDTRDPDRLKASEPNRIAFYRHAVALLRAYTNIADEMPEAGYSERETEQIRGDVRYFDTLRQEIRLASGDYQDLKQQEAAMRYLIDSYIGAEESRILSAFDDLSLVDLLVAEGVGAVEKLPQGIRKDRQAMAETIENNLRRVIIEESPANPAYYENMSNLLSELIAMRKEATAEYEQYLRQIVELTRKIRRPEGTTDYPASLDTAAKRSLYDNLDYNESLAVELDGRIHATKKDQWREHRIKTKEVQFVVRDVLGRYGIDESEKVTEIFELVKNQREY